MEMNKLNSKMSKAKTPRQMTKVLKKFKKKISKLLAEISINKKIKNMNQMQQPEKRLENSVGNIE